jgi:hypothetical protein
MTIELWLADFQQGIPYIRVALFLFEWRWSHDFVNRGRGERRAALPKTRARSHECLDCSRQTSFTAGTIMRRSKLPLTAWFRAAHLLTTRSHLVTTRLSDYTHDPRVALVGPCVLSFRCQERSQAESTARRAYGCGARGRTVQQSRQWLVFRPSKGNGSSRHRSSSTATGGNTRRRQNRSPSPNGCCPRASRPRKPTRTPPAYKERIEDFETNLNHNLYRIWNRMSPGNIVPAAIKAVAVPKKIGGNTFSASRLSVTFPAVGFSSSEFRFRFICPLAS